ncbi:unnamed protein product [Spirodela intermedia]|uniref:FAM86 N-terminal domain-containing protein n=1 Tax=Spirodela intermedia TaxID=51605 RepID=A0A7I8J0A4_SPIIN|nr:unnamed protein product [Spirodela intermedia]CAA6663567.1 unnamed protein product [Spirodela intermedia]
MEEAQEEGGNPAQALELAYLKAAFLAMEPADFVVSFARQSGGGSLTEGVQNFIMENCIKYMMSKNCASSRGYTKNILKKLISSAESSGNSVLEDLYEIYVNYISPIKEDFSLKHGTRNFKNISFFYSNGSGSVNFVVPIQCSSNILEGDTGCSIWPSSLFLSEFILSYPNLFCNKVCLELGAGVGLVGIILNKVKASKVILTDGDLSTLENMQANLEINHLRNSNEVITGGIEVVECKHLLWEVASEMEITSYDPDIVVGADIIYDPLCLPHLVRVLSLLLKPRRSHISNLHEGDGTPAGCGEEDPVRNESRRRSEAPAAYIAVVIRNVETFHCFLELARGAHLAAVDITEEMPPSQLLPYMGSYDRAGVRLYQISSTRS